MAADAQAPGAASQAEQNLEFMDLLAYIYLQHGLADKAAVLLLARDLLAPDHPRALLTLAVAWVRSAKPRKALEVLERLAILGFMDAQFHLVRAQALQALDRTDEAASAMRAYIGLMALDLRAASAAAASAASQSSA